MTSAAIAQSQEADGVPSGGPPSFGPPLPAHIKGGTAITKVSGDGQRLIAIAVGYDQDIDTSKLSVSTFAVEGRTVTAVYANTAAAMAKVGTHGRFVIIELSADDADARINFSNGRSTTHKDATATFTQIGPVRTANGSVYPATTVAIPITSVSNLIVDDFDQRVFSDPKTGDVVQYNLFVPTNYDPGKTYPMVLFMHDAGVTGRVVETTLIQGLGAVIWASPQEQAKHECFVLAPQFAVQVAGDDSEESSWIDTVVDLLDHVARAYSIDKNRLYTTGQSGGAMLSIAINIKYPDLFAASFIVAGQWEPTKVQPLAKQTQWVVVAEGDTKAFPTQNAMMKVYEGLGAKISRATWSGLSTPAQFAAGVAAMRAQGRSINYTVLEKGTVVPEGQDDNPGSNHVNTWRIAYTIEGIRDWLFEQKK
ncbi:alpha/beta hydrolase-fold protein [Asticcacaulis endophyticus]|nr:PHB depolymerase family esterase [Asticcacaulis endophyticus]